MCSCVVQTNMLQHYLDLLASFGLYNVSHNITFQASNPMADICYTYQAELILISCNVKAVISAT